MNTRLVFVGGKPGNFPLTGSDLPSHWLRKGCRGNRKGEGRERGKEGWADHLPYFPPPLASASNTTLVNTQLLSHRSYTVFQLNTDLPPPVNDSISQKNYASVVLCSFLTERPVFSTLFRALCQPLGGALKSSIMMITLHCRGLDSGC